MDRLFSFSRTIFLLVLTWILFTEYPVSAGTDGGVFNLSASKELPLIASGIALHYMGTHVISGITIADPNTLDKNDVPSFDRFACNYYSRKLSHISDNTLKATTGILLLTALPPVMSGGRGTTAALITDMVMFGETEMCIVGLTQSVKGLTQRPRPYAYNQNIPLDIRTSRGSNMSFWSGHASHAFAIATFCGYVFQNRHPGSRFILPVWAGGIACATATSILRVSSGNHFPSDVVAGAAAGAFMGWFVPWLHKNHSDRYHIMLSPAGSNEASFSVIYNFR